MELSHVTGSYQQAHDQQKVKAEIGRCINEIQLHIRTNFIKNLVSKICMTQQSHGGQLLDVLFHT